MGIFFDYIHQIISSGSDCAYFAWLHRGMPSSPLFAIIVLCLSLSSAGDDDRTRHGDRHRYQHWNYRQDRWPSLKKKESDDDHDSTDSNWHHPEPTDWPTPEPTPSMKKKIWETPKTEPTKWPTPEPTKYPTPEPTRRKQPRKKSKDDKDKDKDKDDYDKK